MLSRIVVTRLIVDIRSPPSQVDGSGGRHSRRTAIDLDTPKSNRNKFDTTAVCALVWERSVFLLRANLCRWRLFAAEFDQKQSSPLWVPFHDHYNEEE